MAGGSETRWAAVALVGALVLALPLAAQEPPALSPRNASYELEVTLGRSEKRDLIIPDERVSNYHAVFRRRGPGWTVADASSTNGTRVDGKLIEPEVERELSSGARIDLGGVEALFLEPEDLYTRLQEVGGAWSAPGSGDPA